MASQTITVGLPTVSEVTANDEPLLRFFLNTNRELIDAALVEGDGSAYFGNLQLYFDRVPGGSNAITSQSPLGLRISATDGSESFGQVGPNLTDDWATSSRALVLSAGGETIEIPGPFHANGQNVDASEPYDWLPSVAKVTEILAWMATFMALSLADREGTTLTFDDGSAPPLQLSMSAEAGQPTATFNLREVPPPTQLSMSAQAGEPTAAFNLRVIAPVVPDQLSMSAQAGEPTAAFNLRAVPPPLAQLSMSAEAGQPTATFNLRAILPITPDQLSMSASAGEPTAAFNLRRVPPVLVSGLTISDIIPHWPLDALSFAIDQAVRIQLEPIENAIQYVQDFPNAETTPWFLLETFYHVNFIEPLYTNLLDHPEDPQWKVGSGALKPIKRQLAGLIPQIIESRGTDYILDLFRMAIRVCFVWRIEGTNITFTIAIPIGVDQRELYPYLDRAFQFLSGFWLDRQALETATTLDETTYAVGYLRAWHHYPAHFQP